MEITYRKIGELVPYINNARTHSDEQVAQICASIREYGWTNPVLIDENGMIIAGHGRVMAAQRMKMDEVPCIVLSGLTEAQKKAYVIADNKMALNAGWDDEKLKLELENLKELDFDLELTGFDSDELDQILSLDDIDSLPEDIDEVPEPPKEAKSKLGDIYQLGEHTLMCGDSTRKEDVESLVGGDNKVDLVFTDPPYNVNVENSEGMKIKNDNMDKEDFSLFLDKAFANMSNSLKEGGSYYIWHGDSERVSFQRNMERNGLKVSQCLIWVKNGFNFGRQDFKWKHEPCLYGWKDGKGHYFKPEFNHPTVIEDRLEPRKMKKEELVKLVEELSRDNIPSTVIHEDKPLKNDLHPTMKPVSLCCRLIRLSTTIGESVLDLFGGSGSTLIACEQLKRKCFMMEFDPVYCDVIIERWERFTGRKAVKVNG